MKTSTEIGSIARHIGEERAIEAVAKAGFDAWDFSMFRNIVRYDWSTGVYSAADHPMAGENYLAYAKKLKATSNN